MTTKKTIPFTLEAWKAGGRPVTRGGDLVYDLAYFQKAENEDRLVGVINGVISSWYEDGKYVIFPGMDYDNIDLFLEVTDFSVPEVVYGIVQRNPSSDQRPACLWSYYYDTAESAEYHANWLIPERALAIVKMTKIKDL